MTLADLISTLERLRSELPAGTQEDWAADHDCEYSEEDATAYVHLASDGVAHTTVITGNESDFRAIEEDSTENGTEYYDRAGQAITRYVAALHNALPALIAAAKERGK